MPNKEDTISLDTMSNTNISTLYDAAKNGNLDAVQALIESGVDVNQADENGQTALHYAVRKGHHDIVKLLIESEKMTPEAINKADEIGCTALSLAAERGLTYVVELLLEKMTPDDSINHANGLKETALCLAAEWGQTVLVQWLIEKGANVNQADKYGRTALHWAALRGYKDVVELLLPEMTPEAINKADEDGWTTLHRPAMKGYHNIVELLLVRMSEDTINKADKYLEQTALHFAARKGHHDVVKLLIESGKCDLNAEDREGHDIWTYYPPDQEGSRNMVELLMKHGAKYPEPRRSDGELAKIASSSQGVHSQGKLAAEEYNKFKEGKNDANIKVQLEAQANEFIELLNAAHLSLNEEYHIKMVKDLIGPKYEDIETGQGTKFIIDVSRFAGFEISEDLEAQLLKQDNRKDIKSDLEKLGINPEILKSAIDNLTPDKKAQLVKYSQDKIDQTISYYTTNDSRPFDGCDVTTKDFFGVFGAKIQETREEDIEDVLLITLKEILDAGTMYGTGGASCATGMVSKMFHSSPQLFEDKSEVLRKEEFEFEGFLVNYEYLLTVATMKLRDSGDEDLVKTILNQSKLDQLALTQLEVQKVGAKVYEILKETKNNENLVKGYQNSYTFSEIIYYGGEENVFSKDEKIEQFGKTLDYKTLSDQTYSGLFKKDDKQYAIKIDKEYLPTAEDLEVDITAKDIGSDHDMNTTAISSEVASDIDDNTDHDITMSDVDAYNNQDSSMYVASDIDLVANNTDHDITISDHDITMSGVDAYNNEDSSI